MSLVIDGDILDPEIVLFVAPVVVRGTIRSVLGPFWNQESGQKWESDDGGSPRGDGDYTIPFMYYQVGLAPDDMLVDDIGLDDALVEFLVRAELLGDDSDSVVPAGLLATDDSVIVALGVDIFYMRAEPILALRLFRDGLGNGAVFHVDDEDLVRSSALYANEIARKQNPDVPALDGKPVALDVFIGRLLALRAESHPGWEAYRPPSQAATEEALKAIIDHLATGVIS